MPGDETGRLAALARYRILDTEPEQAFDDLTLLASQICGTPMALITLARRRPPVVQVTARHLRHRDVSQHRVL